jgi:hypothetical protein
MFLNIGVRASDAEDRGSNWQVSFFPYEVCDILMKSWHLTGES